MRILILSDIHANPWALDAVDQAAGQVNHVLCAGDVVSYGPDPKAAISWLRARGAITVRGNHDNAVAFGAHPRASPAKAPLALAVRDWTQHQLGQDDITWLQRLPTRLSWELSDVTFTMVHATPFDPLYDYRMTPQADEAQLDILLAGAQGDIIVSGHTHLPFVRRHRHRWIANPGSVGQPLDGDTRAGFGLWEDGKLSLHRIAYDQKPLFTSIAAMTVPEEIRAALKRIISSARS